MAKMKSEYPNIQVKTFSKRYYGCYEKANQELRTEMSKNPLLKEILDSQDAYMKK